MHEETVMVDTVQSESNSGQLIDTQAEIQKNLLAMQQALASTPGAGGGGAAGGMSVAAARQSSDIDPILSVGVANSKYAKAAEIVATGLDSASKGRGNGMMFGGASKRDAQSRFCPIHKGGISAMPSSYSDRKLMAKMMAKPDKKKQAERKLIAQINGTTSGVAGHSYAHGTSAVIGSGAKVSMGSVASLSAIPNMVSDPILQKF